jgi:hypothetical protein
VTTPVTGSRRWPQAVDYMEAIQNTRLCFSDPRLKDAAIFLDRRQMPAAAQGKSAVVFRATAAGDTIAIRCFTRVNANQRSRYEQLHRHIEPDRPDYMLNFVYRDNEMLVNGQRYPIVEMTWDDGRPLNEWVGQNLSRSSSLDGLAKKWLTVDSDLRARDMAHGDLANDNCLVGKSRLSLVDYDGCYVPALASARSTEAGNPNFQHPKRAGYYGPNMDAFPSLVVYLSLLALEADRALWQRYNFGDNLIFVKEDFTDPDARPVWQDLAKSRDSDVRYLSGALKQMCRSDIQTLPPLGQVVARSIAVAPGRAAEDWRTSWLDDQIKMRHEAQSAESADPVGTNQAPSSSSGQASPDAGQPAQASRARQSSSGQSQPYSYPSRRKRRRGRAWFWTVTLLLAVGVGIWITAVHAGH